MTTNSERPDEKPADDAVVQPEATTSNDEPTTVEATPEVEVKTEEVADQPVEATEVVMQSAEASGDDETASPEEEKTAAEVTASLDSDERLKHQLKNGQRVEVKIVQVGEKDAFLDYGGQSEGTIAVSELKDDKGELRVNVGESFTAIVREAGESVVFTIGRGKGGDMLRLREIESAMEGKIPVQGKIKSTNKGGFEVDLNGVRAFCPFSQIDTVYCDTPEDHVGQQYDFLIIAFERGGRNIVVSRREILADKAKEAAKETREQLAVGKVFDGVVRRIQPYGAFVDIGGIDGLVHVSEISRGHVSHPKDVVKVGEKVQVQVVGIEHLGEKKERVSLSMRVLEADPWENAHTKWPVASTVKGRVVRLTDFGAFVELEKGVDGLVHVSEISSERINHPGDVLSANQEVEVRILSIDPEARRISLSMRPEGEERPARRDFSNEGDEGERRGRPRRSRDGGDREWTKYSSSSDDRKDSVDVSGMDYDDALEVLKRKFEE